MEVKSKDKKLEDRLSTILNSCIASNFSKDTINTCWDLYNGKINMKKYKHVTHSSRGTHAFPARLKNIDKLKTRINYLEGRLLERPFPSSIVLNDSTSIKDKRFSIYQLRLNEIEKAIDSRIGKLQVSLANIEMEKANVEQNIKNITSQIEEIQAQMQNMDDSEEAQQLVGEMQQHLAMLQSAYNEAESMKKQLFENFRIVQNYITNNIEELNIDMEEVKMQKEYTYQDIKETLAQRRLLNFRKTLHIDDVAKQAFRNAAVDGYGIYLVDFDYTSKRYNFEALPVSDAYYPISTNRYIEDGQWVTIKDSMSAEDILATYNITDGNTRQMLENDVLRSQVNALTAETPNKGTVLYSGTRMISGNINRYRTYFIESKKVVGYDGNDGFVVKYKSDNPDEHERDVKESNGTLYSRSIDVLYMAVTIGDPTNPIFQHIEKKREVVRHPDRPSRIKLPVVGNTYNSINNQPYSIAWNTKELIEFNNIVFFTIEKLNNLSGVKGNIMDVSQKPDDMSLETWEYKKKVGQAYIQTKKKGVSGFAYNQFQSYDDTLSTSIAQLFDLVKIIDQMFDMITGISRQSMSQIHQKDGKGTTEMAIAQSDVIVETMYWTHDQILSRALTSLVNLSMMYDNDNDEYIQSANAMGIDIVKVPKGIFGNSYVDVIAEASSSEETDMKSIKQIALNRVGVEIDLVQAISIFNTKTLKDVEKKVKYYAKEYRKYQQELSQNQEDAKSRIEMQKKQMDIEAKKDGERMSQEIESLRLQLEQKRVAIEEQKLALTKEQIESKERIELEKVNQDSSIEANYLREQQRASMVDEAIRMYQAKANALISEIKIYNEKDFTLRKMAIDGKKSSNRAKENIKD